MDVDALTALSQEAAEYHDAYMAEVHMSSHEHGRSSYGSRISATVALIRRLAAPIAGLRESGPRSVRRHR